MMINEEKIKRQCEARHFKVHFGEGVISINTGIANWRLLHNGDQVYKVMHENYRGVQYNNGHFRAGYHEQKLWNFKIKNILNYIEKHDNQFLSSNKYSIFEVVNRKRFVMSW